MRALTPKARENRIGTIVSIWTRYIRFQSKAQQGLAIKNSATHHVFHQIHRQNVAILH